MEWINVTSLDEFEIRERDSWLEEIGEHFSG